MKGIWVAEEMAKGLWSGGERGVEEGRSRVDKMKVYGGGQRRREEEAEDRKTQQNYPYGKD
jgi:hypothetical protein